MKSSSTTREGVDAMEKRVVDRTEDVEIVVDIQER